MLTVITRRRSIGGYRPQFVVGALHLLLRFGVLKNAVLRQWPGLSVACTLAR
jgi:hypothetical protein